MNLRLKSMMLAQTEKTKKKDKKKGRSAPADLAKNLALTAQTTRSHTGLPIALAATVQDANGATVLGAQMTVKLSVTGVKGSFTPQSAVTTAGGVANFAFIPSTTGNATVKVSAAGLASASAKLTIQDIDVTTHHYDNLRTGWTALAPTLTPANVLAQQWLGPVWFDEGLRATRGQNQRASREAVAGQGVDGKNEHLEPCSIVIPSRRSVPVLSS